MEKNYSGVFEEVLRFVAKLLATNPAGQGLCLIGGFRYRLLDGSCRTSLDIDYHWDGDLAVKQAEIVGLMQKKLIPEVRRRFGYEGIIDATPGRDMDSPTLRVVVVRFRPLDDSSPAFELPVEITRIPCIDPPIVRTMSGTVFLTASDADMIEGKIIALFNRVFIQARDMMDIFLYREALNFRWRSRIEEKMSGIGLTRVAVEDQFMRMAENRIVHARSIDRILAEQVDPPVASNLKAAGGGEMIFDAVMSLLGPGLQLKGNGGR